MSHLAKYLVFTVLSTSLLVSSSYAQCTYQEFVDEKDINEKAQKGLYLWNEYLRKDLDSLLISAVELLNSAAEAKSAFAKAVGTGSLGSYLIRSGEIEEGLNYLNEAVTYYVSKADYELISQTYNEIGNGNYLLSEYNRAVKAYLSSLENGKFSPDETDAFNAKLGLGRVYCSMGDTAVGLAAVEDYKSKALAQKKYEATADAYAYIAMIEMDRGNQSLAEELYEKSIDYSRKSKSKSHLSHALNNQAILHFTAGRLEASLGCFEEALKIRELINQPKGIAESYYNIASYYWEIADYHNAFLNFVRSEKIAKSHGFITDEKDALEALLEICGELFYNEEIERIELRLKELDKALKEKEAFDEDVLTYAEETLKTIKVAEEEPEIKEESQTFIYVLSFGVVGFLLLFFIQRRNRN